MAVYHLEIANCSCCNQNCEYTMPTLLIDGTATPYADSATANAALAAGTVSCLIQTDKASSTSASANSTALTASTALVGPERFAKYKYGFAATVGTAGVDMAYSWGAGSGSYVTFSSYDASWNLLETDTGSASSGTLHLNVNSSGCENFYVEFLAGFGSADPSTLTVTVTSNATWTLAAIQAAYTDGGGTNYVPC